MAGLFADQSDGHTSGLNAPIPPSDASETSSHLLLSPDLPCGIDAPFLCSGSELSDGPEPSYGSDSSVPSFQDFNLEFPLPDPDFSLNPSLSMILDPDLDSVQDRFGSDKVSPLEYQLSFNWHVDGMTDVLR